MEETPQFQRLEETILAGGLDWQTPDDRIGQSEVIEGLNLSAIQEGAVTSRLGSSDPVYDLAGDTITSIWRVPGAQVVGTAAGSLIQVSGGSPSTLATGFGPLLSLVYWWGDGYLWVTSQGKQWKYNTLSGVSSQWNPPPLTAFTVIAHDTPPAGAPPGTAQLAPFTGGGGPEGDALVTADTYTWWVTAVTEDGQESNPVQVSYGPSTTPPLAAPYQIVKISATAPAGTYYSGGNSGFWVYRSGGTLNTAYRLPNPGNPGVPWGWGATVTDGGDDINSDTILLDDDIVLEVDHDPPPNAAGVAGPYFGHLLMWNSPEHPNRVWWSRQDKPYAFPGSDPDAGDGNWVDLGDTGDKILKITIRPRYALIYMQNQVHRLAGDPDDLNSEIEMVANGFGLAAANAIASSSTLDVLLAGDGIYSFNGEQLAELTAKLRRIFLGLLPDIAGFSIEALAARRASSVLAHRFGTLLFSYPEGISTVNTASLVYDTRSRRWYRDSRAFTALFDEGQAGDLLAAISLNGHSYLVRLNEGLTDAALPASQIFIVYHSRYHDQQASEQQKTYIDVVVDANTNGANLVVKAFYDHGALQEPIGTMMSTSRTQQTFALDSGYTPSAPFGGTNLGWKARNMALRLEGDSPTTAPIVIYGWTVHYRIEARDGLTFDSGPTDLGVPWVKQVDMLEFQIEAQAPVQITLWSDLPGGTLTQYAGPNGWPVIPATTPRRYIEVPILDASHGPAFLEGRLVRVTLQSTLPFRLYGVRARYRPIPVYLAGNNYETFLTQALTPMGS